MAARVCACLSVRVSFGTWLRFCAFGNYVDMCLDTAYNICICILCLHVYMYVCVFMYTPTQVQHTHRHLQ